MEPHAHIWTNWAIMDDPEVVADHGTLWQRTCMFTDCPVLQQTSWDPADPNHPDGAQVR